MLDTTIDHVALCTGRLDRLRSETTVRKVADALVTVPVNIRHVAGVALIGLA